MKDLPSEDLRILVDILEADLAEATKVENERIKNFYVEIYLNIC